MIPEMTVNITCIHVEHYILLLTILSELSKGKEGDEKELMHVRRFPAFSQWDVETDVCMLIQCVYCPSQKFKVSEVL